MAGEKFDNPEKTELQDQTLNDFLVSLQAEGINTLPIEMIRKGLETAGETILTRDYNCGIRISRYGSKSLGYTYKTWTTNELEDPNHPLSKKFGRKYIIIE